jgi:hypothetical protein
VTASARAEGFVRRHTTGLLALGLGFFAMTAIWVAAPHTGYTRDEGFYFNAAESYARWFEELKRDPDRALSEATIRRYYENNREHPALIKNLMALSYLAFAKDLPRVPEDWPPEKTGGYARAMRLPSQLFSALTVVLTFLLGASVASRRVGLLAALMFFLAPRHFYHAQLACFDMPAVCVWLATMLAWRKAQTSSGWGLATGLVWGLALATKHTSFFIPFVLVLHWLAIRFREFSFSRSGIRLPRLPLAFFSMLLFGPLIFIGHWPFLWHSTLERIGWYFSFHLNHVHYYWEYFGQLLTEPPFPWLYPFALTALTLPLPTLVLGLFGGLSAASAMFGHPVQAVGAAMARLSGLSTGIGAKDPDLHPGTRLAQSDAWLLGLNSLIPFAVIALPSVPIFGGIKHWMHALPFFCVLAALALDRIACGLPAKAGRLRLPRTAVFAGLGGLVLLPSLLGLIHIGGYGNAAYNALAGGVAGAADLGMQRQYWSNSVSGILPWLNEKAPQGARVFLHEVTLDSFRAYKRDGLLRPDLRLAWTPDQADFTVYQVHREFVDVEYQAWNTNGNRKVVHGLYVDEVPLILVYDTRKNRPRPNRVRPAPPR